jgi:hypothetical protein
MGDPNYKRTTRKSTRVAYKPRVNTLGHLVYSDGSVFEPTPTGWRRLNNKKSEVKNAAE